MILGYLNRLFVVNAAYINFSGLTFRDTSAVEIGPYDYSNDGAIEFADAQNCTMSGCSVIDVAGNGIMSGLSAAATSRFKIARLPDVTRLESSLHQRKRGQHWRSDYR